MGGIVPTDLIQSVWYLDSLHCQEIVKTRSAFKSSCIGRLNFSEVFFPVNRVGLSGSFGFSILILIDLVSGQDWTETSSLAR